MRNVIADLAVEARRPPSSRCGWPGPPTPRPAATNAETLLRRIGLAAAKYWVCKRATPHAGEGDGMPRRQRLRRESGMPRLYREAPLMMGIWEGSGNVSALDTLRAMATRPECVEVLFDELATVAGQDARFDARVQGLRAGLADPTDIEYRARTLAEDITLALQGSLLLLPRTPRRRRGLPGHPDGR